jgi:hypothetical protein
MALAKASLPVPVSPSSITGMSRLTTLRARCTLLRTRGSSVARWPKPRASAVLTASPPDATGCAGAGGRASGRSSPKMRAPLPWMRSGIACPGGRGTQRADRRRTLEEIADVFRRRPAALQQLLQGAPVATTMAAVIEGHQVIGMHVHQLGAAAQLEDPVAAQAVEGEGVLDQARLLHHHLEDQHLALAVLGRIEGRGIEDRQRLVVDAEDRRRAAGEGDVVGAEVLVPMHQDRLAIDKAGADAAGALSISDQRVPSRKPSARNSRSSSGTVRRSTVTPAASVSSTQYLAGRSES